MKTEKKTTKPTTITAEMLKAKGACKPQFKEFCTTWPNGCEITLQNCKRAAKLGFNLDWIAKSFLSATVWKAYDEATGSAQKAYNKATATARKA